MSQLIHLMKFDASLQQQNDNRFQGNTSIIPSGLLIANEPHPKRCLLLTKYHEYIFSMKHFLVTLTTVSSKKRIVSNDWLNFVLVWLKGRSFVWHNTKLKIFLMNWQHRQTLHWNSNSIAFCVMFPAVAMALYGLSSLSLFISKRFWLL